MSYLPIARKYRPQTFKDLIGQPHVTATLTRALHSKHLAQAYLFAGMRGVGKTSAARILAKCLNCAKGPTATACNQCASCTQITQGNSLDVIEIDGASNRGIDEIRSLRETVPFAPTSGSYRVYIIDEVHMLTTEAFNALLKTLEEPPSHVKFIFATTAAHKVPSTILSRCQRFDFRRIEAATMVEAIQQVATAEQMQVDDGALYAIARASDGSLRDAEVILEQLASFVNGPIHEGDVSELLGSIESEALAAITQAMLDRQTPHALTVLQQQFEQGKDPAHILTGLLRQFRNLLIIRTTQEAPSHREVLSRFIDEPTDRLARLEEQASRVVPQELLLCLQILTGAYEMIRRSPLAQTILELIVMKLSTREQWQSLDQISRRLEQISDSHSTGTVSMSQPSVATIPSTLAQGSAARATPVETHRHTSSSPSTPPVDAPSIISLTSVPQGLIELWSTFLSRLATQKMSLAAYLADARPLQLAGGVLTVGLPGFSLHQEVLSVTENHRLIDRLLGELGGAPLTVQYVTLPEVHQPQVSADTGSETPPADPPIVKEIVDLFNATVIQQPRPAA